MIAGTAVVHSGTVVTRKVGDFSDCGITVVDPMGNHISQLYASPY
jgi:hypothetical protein